MRINHLNVIILILIILIFFFAQKTQKGETKIDQNKFWGLQSIDTVKYSRDVAEQYLYDPKFDEVINSQVQKIKSTGATHIALGTPYDERYLPFLTRWVDISRKNGLNIWFRGNFSGWEGWFEYSKINITDHKTMLKKFILDNGRLFEDGDIFTSCTECENGGPGDPRYNGNLEEFRSFLIDEYAISRDAFARISKNVQSNYYPMNYDVATLVMDKETTKALGGIVVIDHYKETPETTNIDASTLAERSGGKIVIGEFGAPIPDIHGDMTEKEQSDWIDKSLFLFYENPNIVGINYWTGFGGSTSLWGEKGKPRLATENIYKYFNPNNFFGILMDETGEKIPGATVSTEKKSVKTNKFGGFSFPFIDTIDVEISKNGYETINIKGLNASQQQLIIFKKVSPGMFYKFKKFVYEITHI